MFWESFRTTFLGVIQILLLAGLGYFLVKKELLGEACLGTLSRLVVNVTLPLLIFCQLIKEFSYKLYPDWWLYPLLSIIITIAGLAIGFVLAKFIPDSRQKTQFISLIAFQNSGYLPLALIAALLPGEAANAMLVYLFLFLLGFNLVIWSFGVQMLTSSRAQKFAMGSLFSPPVIATILGLVFVSFAIESWIPEFVFKPMKMVGDCTLPLALMVVGGSLAQIVFRYVEIRAIILLILAKLIVLPLLGLWVVMYFNLPQLLGLLVLMQLAMPPATSLSLITKHYKVSDILISEGVFFGHLVSIITVPIFLSLYFTWFMVR